MVVDRRIIIPSRLSISRDISTFTFYLLNLLGVHLFILHKDSFTYLFSNLLVPLVSYRYEGLNMKRSIKLYEVSETNKKNIEEFIEFKKAQKGNTIEDRSLGNLEENLKKLANFAGSRNLKNLTDKELQDFFTSIESEKYTSRDTYATTYIQFYRWVFKLPKRTPPSNMIWFTFTSAKSKRKNRDIRAKEKYFITLEEYNKMIDYSTDQYGRNKAIWETYHLSGIRPEELPSLIIEDIETRNDGITTITIGRSKTEPRVVGFPETPYNLLQYLENHPNKDNKNAYLFFPFKNPNKPLSIDNIRTELFKKMIHALKKQGVKQTFTLKSFRKTRATIVFENQHKTGLTYKEIGDIFGWTEEQVAKRQAEYLLTDKEETLKKYCNETYIEPTQKQLKKTHIEITEKLKNENIELNKKITNLEEAFTKLLYLSDIKINEFISQEIDKQEGYKKFRQQLFEEEEFLAKNPPTTENKEVVR